MDGITPEQEELVRPPWGAYGRTAVFVAVAGFSKLMVGMCNSLEVRNGEQWDEVVLRREPGRGLITVSNHTRCGAAVSGKRVRQLWRGGEWMGGVSSATQGCVLCT